MIFVSRQTDLDLNTDSQVRKPALCRVEFFKKQKQ